MTRHGTFWIGWTEAQEAKWRKNYEIWMRTVYEFARKGGLVTTGDDAGYLYGSLYGFGISRELELQHEAGFQPLEVLRHATLNGAKVLGLDDRIGRVRAGFVADLLVINGNPLENLRVMSPFGHRSDVARADHQQLLVDRQAWRSDLSRRTAAGSSGRSRTAFRTTADVDEGSQGHGREGEDRAWSNHQPESTVGPGDRLQLAPPSDEPITCLPSFVKMAPVLLSKPVLLMCD